MDDTQRPDPDPRDPAEVAGSPADELLAELDAADPAEAPQVAERLAAMLSDELDPPGGTAAAPEG